MSQDSKAFIPWNRCDCIRTWVLLVHGAWGCACYGNGPKVPGGEPFHKGIPHHPAIRQSKEYDIISSPQKSSHKKRCFHRVSSPGRDVVVCLTDSDAAPDVAWVEEMVEAQRRRLAKCLMFRSCEIGLLLLMEKMLHQLIHIVYTQYFCIYIYTHTYM